LVWWLVCFSHAFEVNRILQVSGLEYSYDATRPAGQRITSATVNGSPLDRSATYTVAANSFLATGGDGFTVFNEGQNPQSLGSDVDALEEYVSSLQQPFGPPADFGSRITSRARKPTTRLPERNIPLR
jgi:5'-nucleotidase